MAKGKDENTNSKPQQPPTNAKPKDNDWWPMQDQNSHKKGR